MSLNNELNTTTTSCNCQERVNMFTKAVGIDLPNKPKVMTREEVVFLVKMVLSEMQELVDTVTDNSYESLQLMIQCLGVDPSKHRTTEMSDIEKIAEQSDAMVDAYYYMLNVAGRNGHNLSKVFDEVHKANMAKVDSETGKCLRREDGKILKPPGWQPPNIVKIYQDDYGYNTYEY